MHTHIMIGPRSSTILTWQQSDEEIESFQKHTYRSITHKWNKIMPR